MAVIRDSKEQGNRYSSYIFGSVLFLGLVVFALLGEFAIRLYLNRNIIYDIEMTKYASQLKMASVNPKIGHVHKPHSSAKLMNVDVKINSDGLRDYEHAPGKSQNHRIVFLGDSLTFGWGVEESKNFKSLIEKKLSERAPTEVLNFGHGNYNTEQEVNLFLEKGPKYKPDAVVLFYFINDAEPTPKRSSWSFLEHSRLISFYWSRFNLILGKFGAPNQFKKYYAGLYEDGKPGWEGAVKAFVDLGTYCRENKIDLKVVLLPELHNLKDYPFTEEHHKVKEVLTKLGIPHRDLIESFPKEIDPLTLWVSLDDAHPNALAHAIIADLTVPFLQREEQIYAFYRSKN